MSEPAQDLADKIWKILDDDERNEVKRKEKKYVYSSNI